MELGGEGLDMQMRGNQLWGRSQKSNSRPVVLAAIAILASAASAECRLPLALAAGQYLNQLERYHLQKYQNNSVCEVLSYEYWNCDSKQKVVLEKTIPVKEVLGNYCMPHLPPPVSFEPGAFTKGAELFSWRDDHGYLWFSIMPGTNREKTTQEISAAKVSEGFLKKQLTQLPEGITLSWNSLSAVHEPKELEFALPPKSLVTEIKRLAAARKLQWNAD